MMQRQFQAIENGAVWRVGLRDRDGKTSDLLPAVYTSKADAERVADSMNNAFLILEV